MSKNFVKPLEARDVEIEVTLIDGSIINGSVVIIGKKSRVSDVLNKSDKEFLVVLDNEKHNQIINKKHIVKVLDLSLPGGYDLKLMSVDNASALPTEGKLLVIVARIGDFYHARIFDEDGKQVLDKGKVKFSPDETLNHQLEVSFSSKSLDTKTKSDIFPKIISSLGYTITEDSDTKKK